MATIQRPPKPHKDELTLSPLALAVLKIPKQHNEVFDHFKVLGARGAASVNCDGYEKLLYITSKQLVFIQRHAKETEKGLSRENG